MEKKDNTSIKIIIITVFILIGVPSLRVFYNIFGWPWHYWGWQTVTIENVGEFQVPGNWIITQYDNVVYMTDAPLDEEHSIYFAGISHEFGTEHIFSESLFGSVTQGQIIQSDIWSHDADSAIVVFVEEGIEQEKFVIYFSNGSTFERNTLVIIAWDNSVDYKTVIKIAKSFRSYRIKIS